MKLNPLWEASLSHVHNNLSALYAPLTHFPRSQCSTDPSTGYTTSKRDIKFARKFTKTHGQRRYCSGPFCEGKLGPPPTHLHDTLPPFDGKVSRKAGWLAAAAAATVNQLVCLLGGCAATGRI